MVKLIYENGRFFKEKEGKLIEVNEYGIPIDKLSPLYKKKKTKKK